jgi:hypothetical protein
VIIHVPGGVIFRRMLSKWVVLATLATLAAGCSNHSGQSRAVLYQGVGLHQPGTTMVNHRISDAAARQGGTLAREQWEQEIRLRATEAPRERFVNLSPEMLKKRLAEAADDHGFRVVAVKLLRPRQLAPEIVIRTTRYLALARALPGILHSLDPHSGHSDTRGWSYEGFFFEAQDERGVPFLGVYNFWRGDHKGGGQWARSEPLYPFPHG